jgi:hypothetical protein
LEWQIYTINCCNDVLYAHAYNIPRNICFRIKYMWSGVADM